MPLGGLWGQLSTLLPLWSWQPHLKGMPPASQPGKRVKGPPRGPGVALQNGSGSPQKGRCPSTRVSGLSGNISACLPPRQLHNLVKLVGERCTVKCLMNGYLVEALWDTGAQVSVVSLDFVKGILPDVAIRDVQELVSTNFQVKAANGSAIPYLGWIDVQFDLETQGGPSYQYQVPFLVTEEDIPEPIIGFNVIREMVLNSQSIPGIFNALVTSFQENKQSVPKLVNLLKADIPDEVCFVKTSRQPEVISSGKTTRYECDRDQSGKRWPSFFNQIGIQWHWRTGNGTWFGTVATWIFLPPANTHPQPDSKGHNPSPLHPPWAITPD